MIAARRKCGRTSEDQERFVQQSSGLFVTYRY